MKIYGRLFIVFILALALIPGVCAIFTGGGSSVSTYGRSSAQGNLATNGVQTVGYAVASGFLSDTETHWIKDSTGKYAEVDVNVPSATALTYQYSLSPNNDKTTISPQSSLIAQEWLDVTNAKTTIQANANAQNGEGDKATVGINMGPGSLAVYHNAATATISSVTAQQIATSAIGAGSTTFTGISNNAANDYATTNMATYIGTVTAPSTIAFASKTSDYVQTAATSGTANSISIYGNAKDSSGTYSVNTLLNGISGGKATIQGLSETASAGTTTQVVQTEHVHGSFSSTATGTRTTLAVTKTIIRTSNYGTEYDLNIVAKKTTSGPEVSGIMGYYVNPTLKIQGAVNAAQSGDIINVAAGKYLENVNINKGLILKGTGSPTASSFTLNAILRTGSGGITAPIVNVKSLAKIQDGVTLASSGGTVNVAAGKYLENVKIDKSLTIKGAGAINTIVDGNKADSVFAIGMKDPNVDVTLSGMTATNGNANDGGGIVNRGTLALTGVSLTDNIANNGGGICNIFGTVTMNSGSITGNIANNGGGICNFYGTVYLKGGSITGNTANKLCGGIYSGGICNSDTVTLKIDGTQVVVKFNKSGLPSPSELSWYQGRGIYLNTGTPTITGGFDPATQVTDNTLI
jgi:hypothetical protein